MISNGKKEYPIRDVFREFFPKYLQMRPGLEQNRIKTGNSIMKCKTGELGYDVSICEECGASFTHAVSCNNRSCPCCQAPLEKKWEEERNAELIKGIAYYHVVFTVPHELCPLFRVNEETMLKLLFKCVNETLLELCADKKYMGAKPGIMSVLHTWGQKLNYHPHIHVCISGGGITPEGKFTETRHKGFFIPQRVLAAKFRGKFLCFLKDLHENKKLNIPKSIENGDGHDWQDFLDGLYAKRWLPFVKETFNGKGNAIKYLARYSYRTAIANSRIVSVNGGKVTFRYKDYTDSNKEKTKTVDGIKFIHLYLRHVLPSGFHRVRFSGYLANCKKTECIKLIHKLRNTVYEGNPVKGMKTAELMLFLYNKDICVCPACSGRLIRQPRGMPISGLAVAI